MPEMIAVAAPAAEPSRLRGRIPLAPLTPFLRNLDERALDRALEELPVPAYIVGRNRRFRWLNRAGIELVGAVVGQPFIRVVAPEDVNAARNEFARKLLGETTSEFPLTLVNREGRRIRMRIASVGLWADDQVEAVLGLAYRASSPCPEDGRPAPAARASHGLTPRQFEVLLLLSEGLETPALARRLGVAEDTARNHIRGLLRELNVHSRLQAVISGYRLGILPIDDGESNR